MKRRRIILLLCMCILMLAGSHYMHVQGEARDMKTNFTNYYYITEETEEALAAYVASGYKEGDIYIAYGFLSERYAKRSDMKTLLEEKAEGASWAEVFKHYDDTHDTFQPRELPQMYLEQLVMAEVSADDIIICDKIAWKSGEPYEALMIQHMEGVAWRELAQQLGLISNEEVLDKVRITKEELDEYASIYGLSQDEISYQIVLADRIGMDRKTLIEKMNSGTSEYTLLAEYYTNLVLK